LRPLPHCNNCFDTVGKYKTVHITLCSGAMASRCSYRPPWQRCLGPAAEGWGARWANRPSGCTDPWGHAANRPSPSAFGARPRLPPYPRGQKAGLGWGSAHSRSAPPRSGPHSHGPRWAWGPSGPKWPRWAWCPNGPRVGPVGPRVPMGPRFIRCGCLGSSATATSLYLLPSRPPGRRLGSHSGQARRDSSGIDTLTD